MKALISSLSLILAASAPLLAKEKPLEVLRGRLSDSVLTSGEEARAKASAACHLQDHLNEHSDYIQRVVFPRIESELSQLLRPQKTPLEESFYITEGINYGDLFHAHVRTPLLLVASGMDRLDPRFQDSREYHLQYHSFEYIDELLPAWQAELQKVDHSPLQEWLGEVQKYRDAQKAGGGFGNWVSPNTLPRLIALTEDRQQSFALAWHSFLGPQSPGVNQLIQRLHFIDPMNLKTESKLLRYRSVVSNDDKFLVIDPLNFKDHEQAATVYFEEMGDSPEVRAVIRKAQGLGLNRIINTRSQYLRTDGSDLHTQLMDELIEAARATSAKDPLYMFGQTLKTRVDVLSHVIFGWSEKYVFSIRYSLRCGEKERELAKEVSESKKFPVYQP